MTSHVTLQNGRMYHPLANYAEDGVLLGEDQVAYQGRKIGSCCVCLHKE
jgi:hypothetical protein